MCIVTLNSSIFCSGISWVSRVEDTVCSAALSVFDAQVEQCHPCTDGYITRVRNLELNSALPFPLIHKCIAFGCGSTMQRLFISSPGTTKKKVPQKVKGAVAEPTGHRHSLEKKSWEGWICAALGVFKGEAMEIQMRKKKKKIKKPIPSVEKKIKITATAEKDTWGGCDVSRLDAFKWRHWSGGSVGGISAKWTKWAEPWGIRDQADSQWRECCSHSAATISWCDNFKRPLTEAL